MTCWLLSMWISNTATCAIAMPIGLGIANTLGSQLKDQITFKRLKYRILFICAFAASVGGICTPVGSPPNLIAISFLSKAGIKISFLEWMIIGIPSSVVMLIALLIILRLRYPLPKIDLSPLRLHFQTELEKLGRVSKHEKHVIACFIITIFLWIAPSALGPIFADNALINKLPGVLPMGIVALIGSLPLFILMDQEIPTLSWKRAVSIDWGTIILFGGGLCLGHILLETGLASDIGKSVLSLSGNNYFLLGAFAILLAVIASEVSSNTAASSIIIPILISSTSGNINALTIAAAYGASFGFMLPVSTPPNAIVYGTGELPLREMIKTGIFFDVIGSFIIFIFIIYFGFAF
jgi:sodium-dependent dicarboxylate transporter 2/3/5